MDKSKNFVVYRSSAGSGKTYTLVKEYLKLTLKYDNPSYYKRILAITFTNAAAAEMKSRVLLQLKSFAQADPKSDELMKDIAKDLNLSKEVVMERAQATLTHILHHYSDFSVSTIDSFVHGIIRTFSRELRLHPEFEIELDSDKVLSRSIDDLFAQIGLDKEITALILRFVKQQIEDEKTWNIKDALHKIGSEILNEKAQESLDKLAQLSADDFARIHKALIQNLQNYSKTLHDLANKGLQIIDDKGIAHSDFNRGYLPDFFIKLKSFGPYDISDKFFPNNTVVKLTDEGSSWYPKRLSASEAQAVESVQGELKTILQKLIDLLSQDEARWHNTRVLIYKSFYSNALMRQIREATDRYKEENDLVLISDFNQKINQIVRSNPAPFIYEKIGERYNHILIDEFQDTSGMQWQNFLPLIENSLAKGQFNLLVGDAKQAIYRWRNGDVLQFVSLPRIHEPLSPQIAQIEPLISDQYESRNLKQNFRSAKKIVEFNNRLFDFLKKKNGLEELYQDHEQEIKLEEEGAITIDTVFEKKKDDRMELTLEKIQEQITENLDLGFTPSDICILIRKKKDGSAIAKMITEMGLSVVTADSLLLKNNPRIQLIVHWLQFIHDSSNERAKIGFLRNYALLQNSNELSTWIEKYAVINKQNSILYLDKFIKDHLPDLYSPFLPTKNLYELVEWISRALKFHLNADQFLERIYTLAYDFSEKKKKGLSHFIEYWEEQKNRLSLQSSSGMEGVQIMTIHASKGLQFPMVIYPIILSTKLPPKNIWLPDGDEKIGLPAGVVEVYPSKTTSYHEIIEHEFELDVMDELNTTYVATTRAEKNLVLLIEGTDPSGKNGMNSDILEAIEELYPDYKREEKFSLGTAVVPIKKDHPVESEILTQFTSRDIFEDLRLSLESGRSWDSEDTRAKDQALGILTHELLAQIDSYDHWENQAVRLLERKQIHEDEKEVILESLRVIFKQEKMQAWFSQDSKSEKTLVTSSGDSLIPDKVVYFDTHIDIIDYKTGKEAKKHTKQVQTYVDELGKIEDKKIFGYLVYIGENKIVKI